MSKEKIKLFKRDFLIKIESILGDDRKDRLLNALMQKKGLTFFEAIEALAHYLDITPEYV